MPYVADISIELLCEMQLRMRRPSTDLLDHSTGNPDPEMPKSLCDWLMSHTKVAVPELEIGVAVSGRSAGAKE